ncbi:uncharacterized protein V6R79_015102 [Siganus canaliculatus]
MCENESCLNSTTITCPSTSIVCKTITSVITSGSVSTVTVHKNCSTLQSCLTPLLLETEWSVNRGFAREAHNQLCCVTNNCNLATLATPSTTTNGKECPSCASSADSLAGTCSSTVACLGVEDSCFNGTTTSNTTNMVQRGCLSRSLCARLSLLAVFLGENTSVACGAPWSAGVSAALLASALAAHRVLL